ncbi:MAG: DNA repair protein RadA [Dehalococcoidia bacterium]|nr:DNA repair protein RadA [Dehalococcoidia bacterium]
MVKRAARTVFVCQQCGSESPKWMGKCPDCNEWNSYVETVQASSPQGTSASSATLQSRPQRLSGVASENFRRAKVGMAEFDRVLGGGLVPGSLVLIGGDPGIGKSTLVLQVCAMLERSLGRVLYVSGEESAEQIRMRADRLGITGNELFLVSETNLDAIMEHIQALSPKLVVIDSIQTVYLSDLSSAAGSVGQVRECTQRLMRWAKSIGVPVFIVGHVTKEGTIAGPRVLEHIVDTVLYLEGERFHTFRLLRSVKNRFGSTNEVGVFEMASNGLAEVDNPSAAFLAERSHLTTGATVAVTLEGTRPILVEVQALTTTTSFGLPRRTANGIDLNRLLLIAAVLTKRVGLGLSNQDIFVNVVGGLRVSEPAADLAVAVALASSFREAPVDPDLVVMGEVGLGGELRSVSQVERRLTEAAKLGFRACLLPRSSVHPRLLGQGIELIGARDLGEALQIALK